MKKPRKTRLENEKRKEIIDWAKQHSFTINPSKGMEIYVQNILKFKHCPCDASRPNCPCPQSVDEVQNDGHCLCRMYWRDLDTFKETLKAGEVKDEGSNTQENLRNG